MVLTGLGGVAEMELGFVPDRNAPTSRPRSRRGLKGPPGHFRRARIVALRKDGMPQRYKLPLLLSPLPICDAWRHAAAAR
jgi:hypothetical protein